MIYLLFIARPKKRFTANDLAVVSEGIASSFGKGNFPKDAWNKHWLFVKNN